MALAYDESHENPRLSEFYSSFGRTLTSCGHRVDVFNPGPISVENLKDYRVLMISLPLKKFSGDEVAALEDFVKNGGGLFLVGDEGNWKGFKDIINSVSDKFGITFNDDEVHDPTDSIAESYSVIHTMKPHPIVDDVDKFVIYGGCSLNLSSDAQPVATGDDDTFSTKEYYKAGEYPPVLAVSEVGGGRVVCIGDGSLFRNRFINEFYNKQLALNIVDWLSKESKEEAAKGQLTRQEVINEIDMLESKYTQLRDDYSAGKFNDDEYRLKMSEYGKLAEELESMLAEVD